VDCVSPAENQIDLFQTATKEYIFLNPEENQIEPSLTATKEYLFRADISEN